MRWSVTGVSVDILVRPAGMGILLNSHDVTLTKVILLSICKITQDYLNDNLQSTAFCFRLIIEKVIKKD